MTYAHRKRTDADDLPIFGRRFKNYLPRMNNESSLHAKMETGFFFPAISVKGEVPEEIGIKE